MRNRRFPLPVESPPVLVPPAIQPEFVGWQRGPGRDCRHRLTHQIEQNVSVKIRAFRVTGHGGTRRRRWSGWPVRCRPMKKSGSLPSRRAESQNAADDTPGSGALIARLPDANDTVREIALPLQHTAGERLDRWLHLDRRRNAEVRQPLRRENRGCLSFSVAGKVRRQRVCDDHRRAAYPRDTSREGGSGGHLP